VKDKVDVATAIFYAREIGLPIIVVKGFGQKWRRRD
jgi:hypothetical protein